MGWFFGFKLYSVIYPHGEVVAFNLTPGNVNDRQPLDGFQNRLFGKLFGDKGYLSSSLRDDLHEVGIGRW